MKNKRVFRPDMDLVVSSAPQVRRICIGTPTMGKVRIEWMMSRFGQIIPCNWSNSDIFQYYNHYAPLAYVVDDAQNLIVQHAVNIKAEWLFLLEDDVLLPQDTFIKLNRYMLSGKVPVVSGLYYAKGTFPEPLIYRGLGNSYYQDWKFGDKVWVSGVPTGCLLMHMSLLKAVYDDSEVYSMPSQSGPVTVRRVFETPRKNFFDPESYSFHKQFGTSDLNFCERVMKNKYFTKAGWPEYDRKKYPFLIDTSIFCQQMDLEGNQYPGSAYRGSKQWIGSRVEREEKRRQNYRKQVSTKVMER